MDFFNKLTNTVTDVANAATDKAKGATDVVKLQYEKSKKEEVIEKQYAVIGKKFYEENKAAVPEGYEDLFDVIEAAKERIAEINSDVAMAKGGKVCPKCGSANANEAIFCATCGNKFESIFEEEDEVISNDDEDGLNDE